MKVSVVIPTYNRSGLLERAVRSVLAQTHRDFELIIVDDGSTDGTEQAVRTLFGADLEAGVIRYRRNERNMERSVCRNTGIALASGPYVALLDDDDFFLPVHLEVLCEVAAAHPGIDFMNTDGFNIDERNRITGSGSTLATSLSGGCNDLCFDPAIWWGSTSFFKKSMFTRLDGFSPELSYGEDREFFWRAAMTHVYGYIAQPTVCRYLHGRSNQFRVSPEFLAYNREKLWLMTERNAEKFNFKISGRIRAGAYLAMAMAFLPNRSKAKACLDRAFACDPSLRFSSTGIRLLLQIVLGPALYRWIARPFRRAAGR